MSDQPKKIKTGKPVPVRVLSSTVEASLVEWRDGGGLHRAYLRPSDIVDGSAAPEALSEGVPFGLDWESYPLSAISGKALAAALHDQDIWTFEDLLAHPAQAVNALQLLYKLELGTLVAFAREQTTKERST